MKWLILLLKMESHVQVVHESQSITAMHNINVIGYSLTITNERQKMEKEGDKQLDDRRGKRGPSAQI